MTKHEEKSKFLNEIAFLSMFVCKPKSDCGGLIEPFYPRFLKIQKYVRCLYIKILTENIKVK